MIILASQSPRRSELLQQISVPHEILPVNIDETPIPGESAQDYVQRITLAKAQAAAKLRPQRPILAADTAVVLDDRILGKPAHREQALAMLQQLSARSHKVLSGVALLHGQTYYRLSSSSVRFCAISDAQAQRYWASGEPRDKAGGYAIQGLGAIFVEQISGSYSGVMGLPLFETADLLRQAGLWRC